MGENDYKMENLKTTIEHGIYNIDHSILHRQVVEVATDWFLDKYHMQNPDKTIKIDLTDYKMLNCWGESYKQDENFMVFRNEVSHHVYNLNTSWLVVQTKYDITHTQLIRKIDRLRRTNHRHCVW